MASKKKRRQGPGIQWPGQTSHDIGMEFAQRAAGYLAPWAVFVVAGIGAALAHWAWGGDPMVTPFVALLFAGFGAALTALTRKLASKTGDRIRRELYTLNAAALTIGITVGLVIGMARQLVLSAWLIVGFALCVATMVRLHMGHVAESGETGGRWARVQDKLGLAQYEVKEITTNQRGTVTAEVQAKDGATIEELQKKVPALSSAYGLGKGRMTVTEDPEDASRGQLRAIPADLLAESIPWPGPTDVGGSIATPVRAGIYEDGQDVQLPLLGDAAGRGELEHLLIMGTTGSGKSEEGRVIVADTLTRADAQVIAIDTTKGHQTFGAVRHGLAMLITDPDEAQRLFKALPKAISARTNYLTERGLKGWAPGCGLSALIIWGEEAADFAADSQEYDKLLRTARSAGIWIATSLQRATYTNISTNSRTNHGAGMCFGIKSSEAPDAGLVLPDEVIEAGAIPTWGARKPGRAFLTGMGAPEERWTMPLRGYQTQDRELAAAVTLGNEHREPIDEVTTGALGSVWTNRIVYTEPLLPDGSRNGEGMQDGGTAVATAADESAIEQPEHEELDMSDEDVAREVADLNAMLGEVADQDPEPDADYPGTGLDDELPADDDPGTTLDFTDDRGKLTKEEGREHLYDRIDAWLAEGRTHFGPKELADIWTRVPRGRRWFYEERDKLIEAGVIADSEEYGVYHLLRSPRDGDAE